MVVTGSEARCNVKGASKSRDLGVELWVLISFAEVSRGLIYGMRRTRTMHSSVTTSALSTGSMIPSST